MILLLQSALRALLLGACVWGLLRLLKLRDARSETAAWTLVLAAALAMPLLAPLLQRWLPATPLSLPPAPTPLREATALPASGDWAARATVPLLWWLYGLGTAAMLLRLGLGLLLGHRLYRRAVPLAGAPALRVGAGVRTPMVFGRAILLPPQWQDWPETRRAAVLAHEQCHLARGDFFWLLAAALYRAFFWFSPFAWWLQHKLSALAEQASDAAGVRQLGDRAGYAELLVEAAAHAQGVPALVAMAKGPDIAWRVDHILAGPETEIAPGRGRRLAATALVLAAAIATGGVHAVLATKAMAAPARMAQALTHAAPRATAQPVRAAAVLHPTPRPLAHRRAAAPAIAPVAGPQAEFTYNPRALLEGPTVAMLPGAVLVTQ